MAANGISRLPTKQDRQEAKLALAATKRITSGRRANLDISQLPTVYQGNSIVNNPNTSGLIQGRPWVE